MPVPIRYKIPDRLNTALTIFCGSALSGLLVIWSRAPDRSGGWVLLNLLFFSLIFLTNYSLFHEAAHHKLHSNPAWNRALGILSGVFFLCPFSIFYVTHWNHHLRNRTDLEMFDLYYKDAPKAKTFLKWYGYLLGFWFWIIPFGAFLIAFGPPALRRKLMRKEVGFVNFDVADVRSFDLKSARFEVLLTVLYFWMLNRVFGMTSGAFFLSYLVGSIWWSTTQYVDHAFAERDVLTGAYNLKASRWYSLINLHRECDLNHHLYPEVSWIYLPALRCRVQLEVEVKFPRKFFFRQYCAQWLGPRTAQRINIVPLQEIVCDYNDIIESG